MYADNVTIEFDLYQIDDWADPLADKFVVVVNGEEIDVGPMTNALLGDGSQVVVDDPSGIQLVRTVVEEGNDIGFEPAAADKRFTVVVTVPFAVFQADDTISLEFKVESTDDVGELLAGVDNLKVTAKYPCAETAVPTSSPTGAPTGSPTGVPTVSPGSPSGSPITGSPTSSPTGSPTGSPTSSPTGSPTGSPTSSPTG